MNLCLKNLYNRTRNEPAPASSLQVRLKQTGSFTGSFGHISLFVVQVFQTPVRLRDRFVYLFVWDWKTTPGIQSYCISGGQGVQGDQADLGQGVALGGPGARFSRTKNPHKNHHENPIWKRDMYQLQTCSVIVTTLTVTQYRDVWLQWHFSDVPNDHFIVKYVWIQWHSIGPSAYSDTFTHVPMVSL